jgi:hypothetical protein
MRGGLGGRNDIRRCRRNAKLNQVISDCDRRTGGIVGDKADLDAAIMERSNAFRGTRHRNRAEIDNAVEIKQHGVVRVDDHVGSAH